ncbi:MAG: rod shape-determining protein MreD [Chthonomonas sp.]|nr:rod shape-determining protein MreD [Chthonomonas sp.]
MKAFAVSLVTLWLAAVCQQALPDRLSILGARPDFLLVAVSCLSLLIPAPGSIVIGFFGGLMHSAMIGANLAQYVLSRMLAGFSASRIGELEIEIGSLLAAATTLAITLGAQLIMMFLAPPRSLGGYIGDTIQTAIYNAVIAIPLYAVLSPLLKPKRT